tara:strand:- start:55 stop:918 length:864 start_codon:yes stop_codon:yes gene_type:complete
MKNTKKLKLGIVGHGFVGKATDFGFSDNVEKFIVDPLKSTTIDDLAVFNPQIVFISVPTPMGEDGTQDASIVKEVFYEIRTKCPNAQNVIKSTVLPSVLNEIEKLDKNVIYNPEFLREKHANEDFINTPILIFGGKSKNAKVVADAYKIHSNCKTTQYIFTDLQSASLIKYTINTFLATKVIFFNELHDLFKKLELKDSWGKIVDIISRDNRIGESHMNVPGHDEKFGFGGACFPKDSVAFTKFAKDLNVEMSVLESAIEKNNRIRSKYENLDSREIEQNISFEDKK